MGAIDDYLQDLNRVRSEWRANWVLPIGSVYANAHARFQQTLDDQRKTDALKAQLAVMALTMGIGGGLGALFGKSAASAVALDGALSFVCNRNMTRIFNAMAYVESSPAASFLAGQLWANAGTLLSDATKRRITSLTASTAPAEGLVSTRPRDLVENPQVAQNRIERYLELVFAAAHRVAEEIRDNRQLGAAEKDRAAAQLSAAPFFAESPTSDIIRPAAQGTPRAELHMELGMYMVLVMNCDFTATGTASANSATATYRERRAPITVSPSSPNYPQPQSRAEVHYPPLLPRWPIFASGVTRHYVDIRFDQLGGDIVDRIDELHGRCFDRAPFFRGRLDGHEIRRAERVLDEMNQRYSGQMQRLQGGTQGQAVPATH